MKKILTVFITLTLWSAGCDNAPPVNPNAERGGLTPITKYSGDLAVKWNRLEMTVARSTAGVNVTRAFAYSGLSFYESMVAGIPGHHSVASKLIGHDITKRPDHPIVYWPASANAAMAYSVKNLFPTTSAANLTKIDSLEGAFNDQFKKEAPQVVINNSIEYGRRIAAEILEWAKTDGAAEAAAKNSTYIVPVGPGLWQPTPPAFVPQPVNAFAKEIRTFVKDSPFTTLAPPPTPYSEEPDSDFFNQVKYLYDYSQHLTEDEVTIVKTWGEFPGNFTQSLRYTQLGIQLVADADLPLDEAAIAFAKHHMAMFEATTCVFVSKYTYNQVRPITYIRGVLGFTTWNSLNTTPPHPEYPAAHSAVGRSSSRIMEIVFGMDYAFTDKTHQHLYGTRNYSSLEGYSDEAGWSRVLGGIHYVPSVHAGKNQGQQVADLINDLFTPGK